MYYRFGVYVRMYCVCKGGIQTFYHERPHWSPSHGLLLHWLPHTENELYLRPERGKPPGVDHWLQPLTPRPVSLAFHPCTTYKTYWSFFFFFCTEILCVRSLFSKKSSYVIVGAGVPVAWHSSSSGVLIITVLRVTSSPPSIKGGTRRK